MSQTSVGAPNSGSKPSHHANPLLAVLAIIAACAVGVAGGLVAGLAIIKFQMLGAVTLVGVGAAGGYGWRYATKSPNSIAGYSLAAACFGALYIAEAYWYHSTFTIPDPVTNEQRVPTWPEAFQRVLGFMWQHAPIGLGVGAISAFLGAGIAFREAGQRYRTVRVVDE